MHELDFENVRGFEPPIIKPFRSNDPDAHEPLTDPIGRMSARLDTLDELTFELTRIDDAFVEPVPQTIPFRNQPRQFARMPFAEQGSKANFHIKGRKLACRLIEMSIGGFGIVVPRSLNLLPGAHGQLHAPGMSYIVRVTRIESRDGETFIGLKQVEEIIRGNPYQPNRMSAVGGYLIAGLAGILIATLGYYFMNSQ